MKLDLDKLEQLASQVTEECNGPHDGTPCYECHTRYETLQLFRAALSPDVVLGLIAELKSLRMTQSHKEMIADAQTRLDETIKMVNDCDALRAENEKLNLALLNHQATSDYEMGQINANKALEKALNELRAQLAEARGVLWEHEEYSAEIRAYLEKYPK